MFGSPVRQIDYISRHGPLVSNHPLEAPLPGTPEASQKSRSKISTRLDNPADRTQRFDELIARAKIAVDRVKTKQSSAPRTPSRKADNSVTPFSPSPSQQPSSQLNVPGTDLKPLVPPEMRSVKAPPKVAWHDSGAAQRSDDPLPSPPVSRSASESSVNVLTAWASKTFEGVRPTSASEPKRVMVASLEKPNSEVAPPTPFRDVNGHTRAVRILAKALEAAVEEEEDAANADTFSIADLDAPELTDSQTHEDELSLNELQDQFQLQQLEHVSTTKLQRASANGDVMLMSLLLEKGYEINEPDAQGRTALMYAVHCNQLAAAKMLLEHHAEVNQIATDGATALHRAAYNGSTDMVTLLLEAEADHTRRDQDGRLPLHWAAHNPRIGCLSALIKKVKGDNMINEPDAAGMTAFLWACYYNRLDHLRKLKRNGAHMDHRDMDHKTASQWAVHKHSTECLSALLTPERALQEDRIGRNVLHYAAEQDAKRTIKFILHVCPQAIHATDNTGRTALHYAGVCGSARAARVLLRRGADPTYKDANGCTALDYARRMQQGSVAALLSTYDAKGEMSVEQQTESQSHEVVMIDRMSKDGDNGSAVMQLFHLLSMGSYLEKFTNKAKGATHNRFFWMDLYSGELCWAKSPEDFVKNPGSTAAIHLVAVKAGGSSELRERRDFDEQGKHQFAFTVFGEERQVHMIAPNAELYQLWVEGLQLVLSYGQELLQTDTANTTMEGQDY
eukprot:TRINITY_DN12358_c1_g1_i5.p1 TRINITY_DN12358_c1_g1~~TRINITY_DN12358_c1_g1_i5.p1  ORF type:complete len:775 (+),score=199.21 TRINITY_DN12358_c1_g1_i5:128-2326(+)